MAYLGAYAVPAALGLAVVPLMTRSLGPAQYGIFGVCLTIHSVLLTLGAEPTTKAITRLYATAMHTSTGAVLLRAIWGLAVALAAAIAACAVLVLTVYAAVFHSSPWITPLAATVAMTAGFTLFQYALTAAYVREQVGATARAQVVHAVAKAVALVAGAAVFESASGSLWVYALILPGLVGWLFRRELRGNAPLINLPQWRIALGYGTPLIGVSLSWVVLAGFDRVVLARVSGPEAAGQYALAYIVADFSISLTAVSLRYAIYPSLVRNWESGNRAAVVKLFIDSLDAFLVFGTTALVVLALGGSEIARVLGGTGFEVPSSVTLLVAIGVLVQKVATFEAIGYEFELRSRSLAVVWIASAAVCIPITVAAIEVRGVSGAAASTALSYGVFWWLVRVRAPIRDITTYPLARLCCTALPAAFIILALSTVSPSLPIALALGAPVQLVASLFLVRGVFPHSP